jgi:hypothetical protein
VPQAHEATRSVSLIVKASECSIARPANKWSSSSDGRLSAARADLSVQVADAIGRIGAAGRFVGDQLRGLHRVTGKSVGRLARPLPRGAGQSEHHRSIGRPAPTPVFDCWIVRAPASQIARSSRKKSPWRRAGPWC